MLEPGRETGKYGRSYDQASIEGAIAALSTAQHTVFTLDQLAALGLSKTAVHKRAANGRLHRIYQAVYSLVPPKLLTREGHWMAAVLACGPGALLSHRNAAALHGLRPNNRPKIEVTVPGRTARNHSGIDLHRSTTLTPADATIVNQIPCTTVARTLLDLADVIDRRGLERAFDQAEILQLFDLRALEDQLRRNPTRAAVKKVEALLAEYEIGSTPTWNDFEDAMLTVTRAIDVPDPECNAWIRLPDGGKWIRGDFVWRDQKLVVETDGYQTHGTRQAFERDRRRDQRLLAYGWRVIRVTWRQLKRAPHEVRAMLLALLRR